MKGTADLVYAMDAYGRSRGIEVCPENSRIYQVKIIPSYLEAIQT